jgi:RNA polymerase sigma factor (sigma-70 family)
MAGASRGIVLRQIDRLYREGTLAGLGDAQLLERYLTGRDEAAFEALVDRHGPMVLGLCRRMLQDPRDIEDAFQATFLILVRKASAIRDRHLLSSWLYGVAFRVASRARSGTLRRRGREIALANLEPACAARGADFLELAPVLDQELNRLPVRYRAPLVLCYLRGQTHEQAAEALSCPVGTVRSRLARGRELLRRRLTTRGYAPSAALLGADHPLPAQLLSEAVPRLLVSATVESAFAFGTVRIIHAGAGASVLALTEGVLMTMKLTPFKWIGLAIATASLSAGGYAAISYSGAVGTPRGGTVAAMAAPAQDPAGSGSASSSQAIADRIEALERKVDALLNRFGTSTTVSSSTRSNSTSAPETASQASTGSTTVSRAVAAGPSTASRASAAGSGATSASSSRVSVDTLPPVRLPLSSAKLRELEARLKLALEEFDRADRLLKAASLSAMEHAQYRGKVLILAATVDGLGDDLDDEIDALKLEILDKQAEVDLADAQRDAAATLTQRNARLNKLKPGMVADEDVAKAEAVLKGFDAQRRSKQAQLEAVRLKLKQLTRYRGRVEAISVMGARARTNGPRVGEGPVEK